ncbi:anthrax toxin receptor-like isoform X2 [Choloepus didactylus]|uniref:anthrax toxin receptor-like isoform X2 n=1 Tax=Choloepus didactylus TaxID=27675 RepID=UPI00189F841F|nr:anthrax toxin receptor-like isoform X2 [Choloepus didactylus]
MDFYVFFEDLVNKFKNPKLRMSFILYSTEGTTFMPLTSDRKKIEQSFVELKKILPGGPSYLQEGLKRANEQIEEQIQGGKMVSSMIIAFTHGTLEPGPYEETKYEAQRARFMGATVYGVGVKDYDQSQLEGFADTKDHALGVTGGFSALQGITDRLAEKSCISLTSLEPSTACVGGEYAVMVRGSGLQNTQNKKSVICRFKFSDGTSSDETAISVEEKAIVCPGVELEEAGEEIFVEISLNKGQTFFANNLKFTSQLCGKNQSPAPVRSTRRLRSTRAPPTTKTSPKTPATDPLEPYPETTMATTTTMAPMVIVTKLSNKYTQIYLVAAMVMLLAVLLMLFITCYESRLLKKPPPPPPPPPKEKVCGPQCPIMIFPCCGCSRNSCSRHTEGEQDRLWFLINQDCEPVQTMKPSSEMGRCLSTPAEIPGMPMVCPSPSAHSVAALCPPTPSPPGCCHSSLPAPWHSLLALPPKPKS